MNKTLGIRTGGRSARIQAAVHRAVRELLDEQPREALTVPQISQRAGVTPSTLYRRWGDLATLLGDVALEQMRPETLPEDTGSLRGDLLAWAQAYMDEVGSPLGRDLLRDVVSSQADDCPQRCAALLTQRLDRLLARAKRRGETTPPIDLLVDALVAPLVYRLLFAPRPPTPEQVEYWLDACLAQAPRRRRRKSVTSAS
ncbi:TetR/AcrR family transcriptional regulator [Halotalea alkalilenta]|uniref:TetR/AcrR family transcriptional regulator n=1 Tax=Halotalea alkalilenta TaxID=376489 RepID=UPI0006932701|nr:TetR/AcrR family transcriptional regulator [Halotalea alkalilenta]